MSTPWRKVLRDAWSERGRWSLVVLAIALGIAGFAAVLSTYAVLTRELERGYRATEPASATLWTDAVDRELIASMPAELGVAAAQGRRVVSGRVSAGPGEWRGLRLFVLDDFAGQRIAKVAPQEGTWPPPKGEIAIERDALQVASVRIGDLVKIATQGGGEREVRIAGTVHDPGQAQARMEQMVYAYAGLATLEALGEEPRLDRLEIVVAENALDEEHVRSVAEGVAAWLESGGHPVRRVEVPPPGKHPHADIMGLLLLIQASFGLFALLLAGVLVVNLLTASMAAQVRHIGVMKAVGASRAQIARIYLGQALLLGATALLVAVPVTVAGGRALILRMAELLNFDIASFAVPWWVLAAVVGVGLAVPLLAAALPVWRGSAVPVRAALATFGAERASFGASAIDRLVAASVRIALPLAFAVRNGFRRRTRLALTAATLSFAGVAYMSAFNVRDSMMRTLDRLFETMRFDLSVSLRGMQALEPAERAARATPGVRAIEGWITTEGKLGGDDATAVVARHGLHGVSLGSKSFSVVGVPTGSALWRPDWKEGGAFASSEELSVVLNTRLAARIPGAKTGSRVELSIGPARDTWTVAGIVREAFAGPVAYVPRSYFERAGHAGSVNALRLALERRDPESIRQVRAELERAFEREGVELSGSATQSEKRLSFDEHARMIYVFLILVGFLFAGVGGLGLATTMSLNVLERRREMGVLRAIGATPRTVTRIVVLEGTAIAVLGWSLAVLVAWPLSQWVGGTLVRRTLESELVSVFAPIGLVTWLAISLALGALASLLPARQAARRSVREALAFE